MSSSGKTQTFSGLACLWLATAVIAGIGLAVLAAPWIFEIAPNDLRRTKTLLEALNDETSQPQFAVMGNSIVMSGIDTELMASSFGLPEPGYNLATTGQNPVDSFLYYQNFPDSIELVIQFTTARFAAGRDSIEVQKYNAMFMYGYRPEDATQDILTRIFADDVAEIFAMGELEHRFLSRWAIKQTADNLVRQLARDDLSLDAVTFDLYSPNNGARPFADDLMERAILRRYPGRKGFNYRPQPQPTEFYKAASRTAAESQIQYVLVISPIHPRVHELYGEEWYQQVRDYFAALGEEGEFPVIDATDAVGAEYFVDAVHLSEAGAVVLSEYIVGEVKRLGLEPGN